MRDPYIIAEIGSNWRTLDDCLVQINGAKECGADAVKFQLFTYKELFGIDGEIKGKLPREWVSILAAHCKDTDIDFMCSAFSPEGFEFLDPYVTTHKIASPEACCSKILEKVFSLGNPIFLSNGCLTIEEQVEIIDGPYWGADDVLLECVSQYPADPTMYKLRRCASLQEVYDISWGISDHTLGNFVAMTARTLGACVFEKHVDFIGLDTADSCVSMGLEEFKKYVDVIFYCKDSEYDKVKREARRKYGRTASGYRPLP